MLLPLADEGPFLIFLATPASKEDGDTSHWVIPIEDGSRALAGWSIAPPSWGSMEDSDEDEVDVTVELLDSPPNQLESESGDIVEVSTAGPAVIFGSGSEVEVTAPGPGPHRVRMTAHGVGRGSRLRVWSWPAPAEPLRVVGISEAALHSSPASANSVEAPGLAAAGRIGNDVDGGPDHRELSGRTGVAVASIEVPGRPKEHSEYFGRGYVWTPNHDGSVADYGYSPRNPKDRDHDWSFCVMAGPEHRDRITGWFGAIWTTPHPDHQPPTQSALWWRWVRRTPPSPSDYDLGVMGSPVLDRDTVRLATFTKAPGPEPRTIIRIEHRDVPVEWVEDLEAWWTLQLSIHAAG